FHPDAEHHANLARLSIHGGTYLNAALAAAPEHIPFRQRTASNPLQSRCYFGFLLRPDHRPDHFHNITPACALADLTELESVTSTNTAPSRANAKYVFKVRCGSVSHLPLVNSNL